MSIRLFLSSLLVISSANLFAQQPPPPEFSPEMMQNMAAVQNCMMQINYQELASMEQKSKQLEAQLMDYCASGNESAAKQLAVSFSDEVMNSNTMQAMKKCAALMPGMEQQLEVPDFREEVEKRSICDIIKENQR